MTFPLPLSYLSLPYHCVRELILTLSFLNLFNCKYLTFPVPSGCFRWGLFAGYTSSLPLTRRQRRTGSTKSRCASSRTEEDASAEEEENGWSGPHQQHSQTRGTTIRSHSNWAWQPNGSDPAIDYASVERFFVDSIRSIDLGLIVLHLIALQSIVLWLIVLPFWLFFVR